MAKIFIIIGSTRPNRRGENIAKWVYGIAESKGLDVEMVDLRDWPLPFYNEIMGPASLKGKYSIEIASRWAAKVGEADGYLIVAAEYNHGYTAVLKNALDYCNKEWNNKPVAFVSYGGVSAGTRAVEQLREVTIELQMLPMHDAVHLPLLLIALDEEGKPKDPNIIKSAEAVLDKLNDWSEKMKPLRNQ